MTVNIKKIPQIPSVTSEIPDLQKPDTSNTLSTSARSAIPAGQIYTQNSSSQNGSNAMSRANSEDLNSTASENVADLKNFMTIPSITYGQNNINGNNSNNLDSATITQDTVIPLLPMPSLSTIERMNQRFGFQDLSEESHSGVFPDSQNSSIPSQFDMGIPSQFDMGYGPENDSSEPQSSAFEYPTVLEYPNGKPDSKLEEDDEIMMMQRCYNMIAEQHPEIMKNDNFMNRDKQRGFGSEFWEKVDNGLEHKREKAERGGRETGCGMPTTLGEEDFERMAREHEEKKKIKNQQQNIVVKKSVNPLDKVKQLFQQQNLMGKLQALENAKHGKANKNNNNGGNKFSQSATDTNEFPQSSRPYIGWESLARQTTDPRFSTVLYNNPMVGARGGNNNYNNGYNANLSSRYDLESSITENEGSGNSGNSNGSNSRGKGEDGSAILRAFGRNDTNSNAQFSNANGLPFSAADWRTENGNDFAKSRAADFAKSDGLLGTTKGKSMKFSKKTVFSMLCNVILLTGILTVLLLTSLSSTSSTSNLKSNNADAGMFGAAADLMSEMQSNASELVAGGKTDEDSGKAKFDICESRYMPYCCCDVSQSPDYQYPDFSGALPPRYFGGSSNDAVNSPIPGTSSSKGLTAKRAADGTYLILAPEDGSDGDAADDCCAGRTGCEIFGIVFGSYCASNFCCTLGGCLCVRNDWINDHDSVMSYKYQCQETFAIVWLGNFLTCNLIGCCGGFYSKRIICH